jgi:hypothetical protein
MGYPSRRHYGSPAVALELRLNVEVDCQGVPGRYILHRVGPYTKVDKRKALIGCLSWHMLVCGEDAHTISIRMVWVKCTTSAECKSIRIAESSVMDSWTGCCLTQCQVLVLQKCFWKNGERCRTEYSEGTAVARLWFGVLVGYCQRNGDDHMWLTWFYKGR